MKRFIVENIDDLDNFDAASAYWDEGFKFFVSCVENNKNYFPVFCIRENGDVDGFMGWNDEQYH